MKRQIKKKQLKGFISNKWKSIFFSDKSKKLPIIGKENDRNEIPKDLPDFRVKSTFRKIINFQGQK